MSEGTFTIKLSVAMWQVIGAMLENGPYKTVAPVLAELQKQIDDQNAPAPAVTPSNE